MGKPTNPKLKKLLNKPVKNKLKRFTPQSTKSERVFVANPITPDDPKVFPKVLQTKSMKGMKVKNQLQIGYTKRSLTTASGGAGKDDFRPDPKILGGKPITKEEVRKATLKEKAIRKSAIEKQMKVPGYVQTEASKKAMTGRNIIRERKIPLNNVPFKTVSDQKKVIKNIRANVQIRQLNKTLLGTEKDTNYKTPPALSKKMAFKRKHTLLPDTRYPYTMGKTKDGKLHNVGSSEYKKLQESPHKTSKLKKVPISKILKEPNIREFAQNVKGYVEQRKMLAVQEAYKKTIKQEKAAGRLGTKMRQIIKGFNKPKRGK